LNNNPGEEAAVFIVPFCCYSFEKLEKFLTFPARQALQHIVVVEPEACECRQKVGQGRLACGEE